MSGNPGVSLIVAMAHNRVIGSGERMPWHLPADLKHFKALTLGHPVLMGRKTFESIGRALPGRTNVVITRGRDYRAPGCIVVYSVEAALEVCQDAKEVFCIGGAELFRQMLGRAQCIYLTEVQAELEGDTYFPELDRDEWIETLLGQTPADEHNPYACRFLRLDRVKGGDG